VLFALVTLAVVIPGIAVTVRRLHDGTATVFGPLLGTFLYWLLLVFLRDTIGFWAPAGVLSQQQIPQITWIFVGVGLMLLVIFRPQGILGNKKELAFGD